MCTTTHEAIAACDRISDQLDTLIDQHERILWLLECYLRAEGKHPGPMPRVEPMAD